MSTEAAPETAYREQRLGSLSRRLATQAGLATTGMVIGATLLVSIFTAVHQYTSVVASASSTAHFVLDTLGPGGPTGATQTTVFDDRLRTDPQVWIYRNGQVVLQSPNTGSRVPTGSHSGTSLAGPFPYVRVQVTRQNLSVVLDYPLAPALALIEDLILGVATIGLAAAVGGGAFGYVAARRMLKPVQSLTQAAMDLRRAPADARLPELSDPQDEIGRLGRVLNDLISDLDQQRQRDRMLLAEAAHQLRTPLQIVQGNAALLAEGGLSPAESQESLSAMQQALGGMTRLTNDLLTLESARTRRPEPQPLELGPWLEGLREDAQALAPELDVRVLAPSAQTVQVDTQILTRAFWAILENALHYTPPGGRVTLGASLLPDSVEVYVRDSGPGIDKDELPFVTERFFRGRHGKGKRGTGLGLPIAKALAESLDAELVLRSASGAGTTATIRLPRDA